MTITPTKFLLVKSDVMSNCVFVGWLRENIQRHILGKKAKLLNIHSGEVLPSGIYSLDLE